GAVGASENCTKRSVSPRMVGASKPARVDEFVTTPSGSAWHPAVLSAQVSGSDASPPGWLVKKSLKPSSAFTLADASVTGLVSVTGLAAVDTRSFMRRERAGGEATLPRNGGTSR